MSAAVLTSLRPRANRSLRLGVVAGALVCTAALAGAAVLAGQGGSGSTPRVDPAQRSALVAWEDAVHPLVQSAGQVVALGPRTGIADIAEGKEPDAQLQQMAAGWERRLTVLQRQVAALSPPEFLEPAAATLNDAMAGYVTAASELSAAATAHGARRTSLIAAASAAGKNADHLYDQATAAIAHWRSRLGLPTDWSG